jgi:hypothetical protein
VVDVFLQAKRDEWSGIPAVQISEAGSTVLGCPCCGLQFIQSGQAPGQGEILSRSEGDSV